MKINAPAKLTIMENTLATEQDTALATAPTSLVKQEPEAPVLFDADAQQRIGFDLIDSESEIYFDYNPVTDARYAEHSRQAKTKIVDGGESLLVDSADALIALWDDVVFDVGGIKGDKPATWKEEIDDYKYKMPSMSAYLAVAAYSPAKVWGQSDDYILTDAYFNGKRSTQKHFLRKKTVEDVRMYRQTQKIPVNARGKGLQSNDITVPTFAILKGELYDQMAVREAEGYAGRVPLWHKVAVVDHVFSAGLSQKK